MFLLKAQSLHSEGGDLFETHSVKLNHCVSSHFAHVVHDSAALNFRSDHL